MATAERLDFDTAAIKTLRAMRAKYGSGPLLLKIPFRNQAVILDPSHLRRVLEQSPEPFATASSEKSAAVAHFEPEVSLVSRGRERAERRRLNTETLETQSPVHSLAGRFLALVDEESKTLLNRVRRVGELHWDDFIDIWFCLVRRIVAGDAARNNRRITDLMAKLRSHANWLVLQPRRTGLCDELYGRIRRYLEIGQPGSRHRRQNHLAGASA